MKTLAKLLGLALIAIGAVNGHQLDINEGFKVQEVTDRITLEQ